MNVEIISATIQQPGGKRRAERAQSVRGESGQRIANSFRGSDLRECRGGRGIGGGNFSSSMANINFFYPE
ncbi:hypothetical protein ACWELJ_20270, partial [Nocardia sp. NPDC004582]